MPQSESTPAPLQFSASFPCDGRFRPAMAELTVKVARSLGYSDDEARNIGQAVERAYEGAAAAGSGHGEVQVTVTLRPDGTAADAIVRCPQRVLLQLTRSVPL